MKDPDSITIRRAEPSEHHSLSEIALAAKRHWGYPEEWIDQWEAALTIAPEFVRANDVYVATEHSRLLGFYGVVRGAQTASLEHLWVRPEAMDRGVGRKLFADAVSRARAGGAHTLTIDSDPNAEGFYLHAGARKTGEVAASFAGVVRIRPQLEVVLGDP